MADRKKPVVTFTCERKLADWLKTLNNKSQFLETLVRAAYRVHLNRKRRHNK